MFMKLLSFNSQNSLKSTIIISAITLRVLPPYFIVVRYQVSATAGLIMLAQPFQPNIQTPQNFWQNRIQRWYANFCPNSTNPPSLILYCKNNQKQLIEGFSPVLCDNYIGTATPKFCHAKLWQVETKPMQSVFLHHISLEQTLTLCKSWYVHLLYNLVGKVLLVLAIGLIRSWQWADKQKAR